MYAKLSARALRKRTVKDEENVELHKHIVEARSRLLSSTLLTSAHRDVSSKF